MNRILILGDSSRGKTTLAKKLSQKLIIPYYSTDDFYWRKKYTIKADEKEGRQKVMKVYKRKKWIVEGTSKGLIKPGLHKADTILWLVHKSVIKQILLFTKRHLKRKDESIKEYLELCKHFIYRKYRIGYEKNKEQYEDILKKYKTKTIKLSSFKEINVFIKNLK